jgi:hypothetical protein
VVSMMLVLLLMEEGLAPWNSRMARAAIGTRAQGRSLHAHESQEVETISSVHSSSFPDYGYGNNPPRSESVGVDESSWHAR